MNNFTYFSTVRTMFNKDLKEGLKAAPETAGANKAFIITDVGIVKLPIWKEFLEAMKEIDFPYDTYEEVKNNPTDVNMTEAANALKKVMRM